MGMLEIIFAVLIGLGSLVAFGAAMRAWGRGEAQRQGATGWLIFAIAGAVQVVNLLTGYNLWIAILTTIAMAVGVWMGRAALRRV